MMAIKITNKISSISSFSCFPMFLLFLINYILDIPFTPLHILRNKIKQKYLNIIIEVFNDLVYLFLKKVYDETIISNYYILL
jgi:hypothetical protein